jgi:hypothetical protein
MARHSSLGSFMNYDLGYIELLLVWVVNFRFVSGTIQNSGSTSRLLVTYLDRDMEFVWTPKHSDKMSWHRNSSIQIKPLQPTDSFFLANPAAIGIDSLDFQSGRPSKKGIFSESPSSESRLSWATS